MNVARAVACLLAVVLVAPTTLAAATSLATPALDIMGDVELRGDAAALLAVANEEGFSWTLTAPSAEFTRLSAEFVAVLDPLRPDTPFYYLEGDWQTETESFRDLLLTSQGVTPGGGLLATTVGGEVVALAEGVGRIVPVSDPRIEAQPTDVSTGDDGSLRAELDGDFLVATFTDSTITLRGPLVLQLHGPAYTLVAAGVERAERTGQFEERNAAAAATGRNELHTFAAADAVLQIHAPEGADLYTRHPELRVLGSLSARDAEGSLLLPDGEARAAADGTFAWAGSATFLLSAGPGRVLATAPAPVVAAGATVAQAPSPAFVTLALTLVALAATGAVVLWRRRPREDDLQAALLAMEERRWDDALPPLTRLARRRPDDPALLVDRALCLEQTGRLREAARTYEVALRHAPRHAEAHFYYARTLARMRESEAARVHLETALEQDPRLVEMARREVVLRGL